MASQRSGRHWPRGAVWLLLLFAAELATHATLLRLPYFWDEGGYYIPAAWDFFRTGTLIPFSTMRNAHPPLPSILLGAWWKLAGFHVLSTRIFVCAVASAALLAVYRIARRTAGAEVALAVLALTAVYPVWFAQSTLAHADIFAAAFSLWGLDVYVASLVSQSAEPGARSRHALLTSVLFALAALAKETAIVLPATLFVYELVLPRLKRAWFSNEVRRTWLVALAFPALPLALWYAYHHAKTGFAFGNPEFLRYNATANFSLKRMFLSLRHRFVHLFLHMDLWFVTACTAAVAFLPRRDGERAVAPAAAGCFAALLLANWIAFSVLGGALLTRYLLPVYPLFLLLCVSFWKSRTRWWAALAMLSLAAFAIACEVNPPYPFAPEDNLSYRDMVRVHQDAIGFVTSHYPGATVLTAWPVAADLQRPELGYVEAPVKTVEIQNFTAEEVARAAGEPNAYDVALVFATKYDPPPGGLNLAGNSRANDRRFYDDHVDLFPGQIAARLHGNVVWQEDRKGEWAAVIVFPRGYDALLESDAFVPGKL